MPRADRPHAADLSRQGVRDEVLPRMPPRPSAAPAPPRRGVRHGLEAAARSRGARPSADEALPNPLARAADFVRSVPPVSGRKFWRSLEEYQASDAFGEMLQAEFPSLFDLWLVDRRELLRVMGASLALAGMTGCKPARSDDVV